MISQIVYTSDAIVGGDVELAELQRQIVPLNNAAELTGILLCGSGRFLQVIEGDPLVVTERFWKIYDDPRHTNVRLVRSEISPGRLFGEWSMKLVDLDGTLQMGAAVQ